MNSQTFNLFLIIMACVAVVVFVSLFFVDAGYGKFYDKKWGLAVNNKLGWVLMESPVFFTMLVLWLCSDRRGDLVRLAFLFLFELHYIQRSFVFPMRMRGHSLMPLSIVLMGVVFNVLNALMQGGWIFYLSPEDYYPANWLTSPKFIIGFAIFIAGMFINIQSDDIIRNLRKEGDTNHYLPTGGMSRPIISASSSSGSASPSSLGRGLARFLLYGLSPISVLVPTTSTNAIKWSLATSWTRKK